MFKSKNNKGFTLVELLIVIGIVAILVTAVIVLINPAEYLRQARDSRRVQDLTAIDKALQVIEVLYPNTSFGNHQTVYISIPDTSDVCANLGLPNLPSGWGYHCVTEDNLQKINGNGWIPVDFSNAQGISFSNLPIDPVNATSSQEYYTYTPGSWALTCFVESQKHKDLALKVSGGLNSDRFQIGRDTSIIASTIYGGASEPGAGISASYSSITVTPSSAKADGIESISVVVSAKNDSNQPVEGATIVISSTGSGHTITQPPSTTDSNGNATGTIISTTGEIKTISATVDGVTISQPASVTFNTVYTAGNWSTDSTGISSTREGNAIAEVNGNIYIINGYLNGGKVFQKYNTATKAIENLTSLPVSVSSGASLVRVDNNTLYAFIGNNTVYFYKYIISDNTWTRMADFPRTDGNGARSGASLTYPGTGDYIYATLGVYVLTFAQYSIANDSWSVHGIAQGQGNNIVEVSGVLYVINGNGTVFHKYEASKNKWTLLGVLPFTAGAGSSMVKINSDTLYVFAGNSKLFYKYTISTDTWTAKADAPTYSGGYTVHRGAVLLYPGVGDYIYATLGGYLPDLWQYSIANDSWSTHNYNQGNGNSIAEVSGVLYVVNGGGTVFHKYEASKNKWTLLGALPFSAGEGGTITKVNSDTLYAFKGGDTKEFYQYTISTDTWVRKTDTPGSGFGPRRGATLAYPGSGDYIYATYGKYINGVGGLIKYSISGNSWSQAGTKALPADFGSGSASSAFSGDIIYFIEGGDTSRALYKYVISTDTWTLQSTAPNTVSNYIGPGAGLTNDGTNLYITQGYNTKGFYSYNPSTNTWTRLVDSPVNIGSTDTGSYGRGQITYSSTLGSVFVVSGNGTEGYASIMKYNIATNGWPLAVTLPLAMATYGGGLTFIDSTNLYFLNGGSNREFYSYNIDTGVWTSRTALPNTVSGYTGAGMSLTSDGNKIYASQGYATKAFYSYNPTQDSWTRLSDVPMSMGVTSNDWGMGGIIYSPTLGDIFVVSGNGGTGYGSIMKYHIATNSWPLAVVLPTDIGSGSAIYAMGGNIYLLKGYAATGFYSYNIESGIWSLKASVPATVGAGGSLTGDGDKIYALRGYATTGFYIYDPGTDSWTTGSVTPNAIGINSSNDSNGGGIVFSSIAEALYVTPGLGNSWSGSTNVYKNILSK